MTYEREMRKAVCLWLDSCGYIPLLECWSCGNCDIVGVKLGDRRISDVVCVELKLRDIAGVLRQLDQHAHRSMATYAAFPAEFVSPKIVDRFISSGHGLLAANGDNISVAVRPVIRADWKPTITCRNARRRAGEWRERLGNVGMLKWGERAGLAPVKEGAE